MAAKREAEVTDGPQINEASKRMANDAKRGPTSMLDWERKRQARLERRKREQDAKEAAQLTAKPAMSKGSQRMVEKKMEEQRKVQARAKIYEEAARIAAVAGIDPEQLAALGIGPGGRSSSSSRDIAMPSQAQTPGRGLAGGRRREGNGVNGDARGGGREGRSSSVPRPRRSGGAGSALDSHS